MVLPPSSKSSSAVRRMCASGVCQRMISGTMLAISAGLARSLWYSSGLLVQRQQAAADRVAGGVVAADDQQHQVAHVLLRRRMFRVASPCASIEIRSERGGALTRSFHSAVK